MVPHGHTKAVRELAIHAAKDDAQVRRVVLEALQAIAARGDATAVEEVATRLWDEEPAIRALAVRALGDVTLQDDDDCITRVCLCLEDEDKGVREAAVDVLPRMAGPDSERALECLAHCARNTMKGSKRENTREAACMALSKWASRGSQGAVVALCGALSPDLPRATVAALRGIAEVARPGDRVALEACAAALAHPTGSAREAAAQALELLADRAADGPLLAMADIEGCWTGGLIEGGAVHVEGATPMPLEPCLRHCLRCTGMPTAAGASMMWARLGV